MPLTIALVQYNFNVGFIAGNVSKITALYHFAVAAKADLVVFSEMAITGYPPEDLVLNRHFQDTSMEAVLELASITTADTAMLVGGLWRDSGGSLYNTVFLIDDGKVIHQQYKHHLPNYGVFDEKRLFTEGPMPEPVAWRDVKLGLLICEDMWLPDVCAHLKENGADILLSINASPFEIGKVKARESIAAMRTNDNNLSLIYVNQVGGQDDLVFDGSSFVISEEGTLLLRMHAFREDLALSYWRKHEGKWMADAAIVHEEYEEEKAIYHAMMLSLRDFVDKNGFAGVILGLSGGIDSALSAAVAVDALGEGRVRAVMIPSPFTSHESIEDATECAKRLGIRLDITPIEAGMNAFETMLAPIFHGPPPDMMTQCNQTRLRASILMAISGHEKLLLLNTGNKSEISVGYTTIYGDMCGHYSVLKDLYKTNIYKVVEWRNRQSDVIPQRIITKAPSAELHPGQTDQDTLPPYEVLDAILQQLVEKQRSVDEVILQGFECAIVEKVNLMLFAAEYKRRQAPPGTKLTSMSLGHDRRYPLTTIWRGRNEGLAEGRRLEPTVRLLTQQPSEPAI